MLVGQTSVTVRENGRCCKRTRRGLLGTFRCTRDGGGVSMGQTTAGSLLFLCDGVKQCSSTVRLKERCVCARLSSVGGVSNCLVLNSTFCRLGRGSSTGFCLGGDLFSSGCRAGC